MTFEIVIASGFILIVVVILIVALVLAFQSGQHDAKKEETKDATRKLERHNDPLPPDSVYGDRLRRQARRLARLRNRETKH